MFQNSWVNGFWALAGLVIAGPVIFIVKVTWLLGSELSADTVKQKGRHKEQRGALKESWRPMIPAEKAERTGQVIVRAIRLHSRMLTPRQTVASLGTGLMR